MASAVASVVSTISSLLGRNNDYDPHKHRKVEKPTNSLDKTIVYELFGSNFDSLMHLLKSSIGTGLLAMPQAFARAGMITATVSTFFIGLLITHCLHLIVKNQYAMCKRKQVPLLSYPVSYKEALLIGPKCCQSACCASCSKGLVDLFNITFQLGICCVYIVFIADNIKKMVDPVFKMHVIFHMLIFLVPLLIFNCIRNLKFLAPFSAVANVLTLISVLITYILLLTEKKLEGEVDMWGSFTTFPLFFGTICFALTAVGVVIAIENNMKTPKDFVKPFGVLNIGMVIVVCTYVSMGVIGQSFCRTQCADSITLNLSQDNKVVKVSVIMFVISIFISYVLQGYVPIEIIWKDYIKPKLEKSESQHLLFWEYVVRISICLLTFGLAMAVPMLGYIISLTGALCLSAIGLIFPPIMDICVRYNTNYGPCKIILIKDIFIIFLGLCGMFTGTFFTIKAMVEKF